MLIIGIEVYP